MSPESPRARLRRKMAEVKRASPERGRLDPFLAVARIALRNLGESFTRRTVPVPGVLDGADPGPCAASVWWAGQATCLVGLAGRWILTDPNLSPVIGRYVRRVVAAGFGTAQLPPLDLVVLSHAHLDHMDLPTLLSLPGRPLLVLPPGSSRYIARVRRSGRFGAILELQHFERLRIGRVQVAAVPAVHDGWRYGVDAMLVDAHASGYVFESPEATVYYVGDTAYDPGLFQEIGRRFRVDVLLCPVGPLEPRWLMIHFHADPADALRIFEDVGARHMLPIHHNTFVQSWEEPTDAIQEFLARRASHPRGRDTFVLRQGEQAIYERVGGAVRFSRVRSPYPEDFSDPRIPADQW